MLGVKQLRGLMRFLKSLTRRKENKKPSDISIEENPKTLLQTYLGFLSAQFKDVQRWDKNAKGLRSIVLREGGARVGLPKWKPLQIRFFDEELFLDHCEHEEIMFSQIQRQELEERLRGRLRYLEENEGRWDFLGPMLKASIFRGAFFCERCQTRFLVEISFASEKVPRLLEELQRD